MGLVETGPDLVRGDAAPVADRTDGHTGLGEPGSDPVGGVSVLDAQRLEGLTLLVLGGQLVQQPLLGQAWPDSLRDRDLELLEELVHSGGGIAGPLGDLPHGQTGVHPGVGLVTST